MGFKGMNWVWNLRGYDATVKLVLLLLVDRENVETGRCNPSLTFISEETGLSRQSIQRCIKILKDSGLITVITGGKGRSNSYRINWKEEERFKMGDAPRPKKDKVCKQIAQSESVQVDCITVQADCTSVQGSCTEVCKQIAPNPYTNPSLTLNEPLQGKTEKKHMKQSKQGSLTELLPESQEDKIERFNRMCSTFSGMTIPVSEKDRQAMRRILTDTKPDGSRFTERDVEKIGGYLKRSAGNENDKIKWIPNYILSFKDLVTIGGKSKKPYYQTIYQHSLGESNVK